MQMEGAELVSWLLLGGMVVVFAGLAFGAWWLFQRHRRQTMRTEVAEELHGVVSRLGLGTVWQAPLFQSDVFGIRGVVDGFDVRAELWDSSNRAFFRLAVLFPQPTNQGFRVVAGKRRGLASIGAADGIETGDRGFDELYTVYSRDRSEQGEWIEGSIGDVLAPNIRRRLISLGERVHGLRVGNNTLYLHVDDRVDSSGVERLIRDGLSVARELYNRAVDVGPTETGGKTTYEMASVDSTRRQNGETIETEAIPEGTSAGDLPAVGSEDDEEAFEGRQVRSTRPFGGSGVESTSAWSAESDRSSDDEDSSASSSSDDEAEH